MSESVVLPALGESVTEGTITRWLKQVGDTVAVDEPLVEVSTDKVDTEIPSPVAGTLQQILVQEDETVEVGTALAVVGSGSAPAAAPAAPAAAPAPAPAPAPAAAAPAAPAPAAAPAAPAQPKADAPSVAAQASGSSYLTPLVRKLAAEKGVDVATLVGTGVGGRIRKEDVIEAAEKAAAAAAAASTPAAAPAAPAAAPATQAPATEPAPQPAATPAEGAGQ